MNKRVMRDHSGPFCKKEKLQTFSQRLKIQAAYYCVSTAFLSKNCSRPDLSTAV